MKKTFLVLLLIIGILFTGCEKEENKEKVLIDIENYGQIEVELYREYAPTTVDNFLELVKNNFYDGLTFHRIIKNFMIQGGDAQGKEGWSEKAIFGEFANNGYRKNTLKHVRGTISMARTPYDNNSATTQFFIVQKDSPHLDGDYAAFGKVTKGIEIVDKICDEVKVEDDNGTVLKENQPVIKSITIVE